MNTIHNKPNTMEILPIETSKANVELAIKGIAESINNFILSAIEKKNNNIDESSLIEDPKGDWSNLDLCVLSIKDAESNAKYFKNLSSDISKKRLEITRTFTAISTDMSVFEKDFTKISENYTQKVLKIKLALKQYEDYEILCKLHFNSEVSRINQIILNKISSEYNYYLYSEYNVVESVELAIKNFYSTQIEFKHINQMPLEGIKYQIYTKECLDKWNVEELFLDFYNNQVYKIFSNFTLDKKNKENSSESLISDIKYNIAKNNVILSSSVDLKRKHKLKFVKSFIGIKQITKLVYMNIEHLYPYYKGRDFSDIVLPFIELIEKAKDAGVEFEGLEFEKDYGIK